MYDSLERARYRLYKPHVYDSLGRTSKAMLVRVSKPRETKYEYLGKWRKRLSGQFYASAGVAQDDQPFGSIRYCQLGRPLTACLNKKSTLITNELKPDYLIGSTAEDGSSVYEILCDRLNSTLPCCSGPSNPSYDSIGDIITILKDMDVFGQLCRILSSKSTSECEKDCLKNEGFKKEVNEKSSIDGFDTHKIPYNDTKVDEPILKCPETCKESSINEYDANLLLNENGGFISNHKSPSGNEQLREVEITTEEARCAHESCSTDPCKLRNFFNNEQPVSPGTVEEDQDFFRECDVLEPADVNYSNEFSERFQAANYVDEAGILPCLNQTSSLESVYEEELNMCDQFPNEHVMPFSSELECPNFEDDFDSEVLSKLSGPILDVPALDSGHVSSEHFECPDQDYIDTVIDTFTLSKAYCGGDKQYKLKGDDGARGDGLHFNLGLHQSRRCSEDGPGAQCRNEFTVLSDPSPQDRLARIFYKTQPSDVAEGPVFVFSSSTGFTDKTASSSKALPLDFNLNAVYKLATRDDVGSEDVSHREKPDTSYAPVRRSSQERIAWGSEEEQSKGDGIDIKTRAVQDFAERGERCSLERGKLNTGEISQGNPTFFKKDKNKQSIKPYVFTSVLVALLAVGLLVSASKYCFSQLFWDILMHLFIVGIMLLLLITALEANNLTESAVEKLQCILWGKSAKLDETHKPPASSETTDHNSSIVTTDQLVFDLLSKTRKDFETATDDSEEKGVLHGARKQKQGESCATSVRQNIENVFAFQELQADAHAHIDDAVQKYQLSLADLVSVESGHVFSNSENDDFQTPPAVSHPSMISKSLSSKTLVSFPTVLSTRDVATSSMSCCSIAQTMTDDIGLETSSTQTDSTVQKDVTESSIRAIEIFPGASSVLTANASVQADMDARKVYQQTERLQQKHNSALRKLHMKYLAIRRRCQMEAMSLKQCERRKNDFLCKLQLSLPTLLKEKSSLMAERASIDKQFEEEKKKNRELVGRLTRLNQQFYRLGQIQQPPPPPPAHWRHQYHHQTFPGASGSSSRAHGDQNSQQQQQQQQKGSNNQQMNMQEQQQQQQSQHKIQPQSTLLQNQTRTNPFMPSTSQPSQRQQQPPQPPPSQQQQQATQQPQQMFHQQGMPVFQLFNNKSFCQPYFEAHLQQQQQQQQQQQPPPPQQQQPQQQQQQQLHQQKMQP